MNKTNTSSIAKLAAIVAGSALVAMSFAAAIPAAHAQTTTTTTTMSASQVATLEAQIASLQAQLSAATGATTPSAAFTEDLTIGSTGSQVTELQTWLISKGYSIPAGATGYFGTETQAAVAAFQAANGISPDVGYFGPITMAKVNSMLGTTTTTTTTTTVGGCAPGASFSSTTGQACGSTTTTSGSTTLSGGEGNVSNFQTIGASTVILGQGANQNVYGFSFTASGSDLLVSRINYDAVYLQGGNGSPTGSGGSIHPWNVFQTATLTDASGQTVATVDATNQNNWSEEGTATNGNQIYQLSFSGLNQVVKEGTSQTYYLMLQTQSVISSANNDAEYQVGLESQGLRATDALGLQEYSATGSTNGMVSPSTVEVQATTAGTAVISAGSDNPTVTTIQGNLTTPTNNVVLNTFTVQANGENLELYSLPVTVTSTGASPSTVLQSLSLYQGSTLLDTVSPAATSTVGTTAVNFNNLNLQIPSGTTDSFSIQANVSPIDGVTVPNGSSVVVSVPNAAVIVGNSGAPVSTSEVPNIEDNSGNTVNVTGASIGNAISFASLGIAVGTPTTSATVANNGGNVTGQTGTFTFNFNVTAFGQAIYIASTTGAFSMTIHDATHPASATTTPNGSAISSSATRSSGGNYVVQNGQTQNFTVTGTVVTGGGDFYYATLNSLKYGTSDSTVTASSTPLPTTFTTSAVAVNS